MSQFFCIDEARADCPRVVQLCHGYDQPFLDVADQYVRLFEGRRIAVTTVYLTGTADVDIAEATGGDEVVFLEYSSRQIRGLKLGAIRALRRLCRERDVQFVIAHRYKAIYIASHVPDVFVVGVHHAFGDYERASRSRYINRRRQGIGLLGVSNAVRDDVRATLPKWSPERIATLYNRVDYPALKRALVPRDEARRELGIEPDCFAFVNVGRLHPDKDQKTLIEAFALIADELPHASLYIIGKGRLQAKLEQQIADAGLHQRVFVTGPIPGAARLLAAFDGFLLSSDHEPFGMVLLEAMAAGLPIACSDCGGGPEVVGNSGLLFPLGDSQALAQAMRELHELEPGQRQRMVELMDARVERLFTPAAAVQAFDALPFVREHLPGEARHGQ